MCIKLFGWARGNSFWDLTQRVPGLWAYEVTGWLVAKHALSG